MRHLSESELIDLAERGDEVGASHLRECERCRRQLADLCETMSAVAEVDVPDPSPLFWEHFSSRVRDAVAAQGRSPSAFARRAGLSEAFARRFREGRRVVGWAGAAALLAIVLAALAGSRLFQPADRRMPTETTAFVTGSVPPSSAFSDDAALALVADLASNLDDDAATELATSAVAPRPGVVEESVGAMSAQEREELGRLIGEEMKRPGI